MFLCHKWSSKSSGVQVHENGSTVLDWLNLVTFRDCIWNSHHFNFANIVTTVESGVLRPVAYTIHHHSF